MKLLLVVTLLVSTHLAQGEIVQNFLNPRCPGYSPGKYNLYWGDLHTHSDYSFDAIAMGTRMSPIDEYNFAKGTAPILLQNGKSITIPKKLDFLAATDHSEFLGALELCTLQTSNPISNSPYCQLIKKGLYPLMSSVFAGTSGGASGGTGGGMPTPPSSGMGDACKNDPDMCMDAILGVISAIDGKSYPVYNWQRVVSHSESANNPCSFTTFNSYEYSLSGLGGGNMAAMHRNVIFANNKVPSQAFNFIQYPTIFELWNALEQNCTSAMGCEVITIPHNSNESYGGMFNIETATASENNLRAKYEPLVEIIQGKGSSECLNPGTDDLSSEDCNFEIVPDTYTPMKGPPTSHTADEWNLLRSDYVRTALERGLSYYQKYKVNPVKMGFAGATDNHNAAPGFVGASVNANWHGNHGVQDDTPEERLKTYSLLNPGAITAVWAEENTRASIFSAIKKRRTYASSGPRIAVKFFQTWNQTADPCSSTSFPGSSDIIMGGDMVLPLSSTAKPKFVVNGTKDATNLARIDIVKAVIDASGKATESVVSLYPADKVNGASALCKTWVDNAYDKARPTFYYARVIELPTYRWSHYDCVRIRQSCDSTKYDCPSLLNACNAPNSKVDRKVAQRVITSPIWSVPK